MKSKIAKLKNKTLPEFLDSGQMASTVENQKADLAEPRGYDFSIKKQRLQTCVYISPPQAEK